MLVKQLYTQCKKDSQSTTKLNSMPGFLVSDLDADTLGALGDVQDLNSALDGAIASSNPTADILTRLVASPFIVAIPIGAGVLVAVLLAFFISSYSQGRND